MCFVKQTSVINLIYSGEQLFSYKTFTLAVSVEKLLEQLTHDPKLGGLNPSAVGIGEK
jgi:hypothetical protein